MKKIDAFRRTNVIGDGNLWAYVICRFGYFLSINFNYEPHFYNGCHGLMIKVLGLNKVPMVSLNDIYCKMHYIYT